MVRYNDDRVAGDLVIGCSASAGMYVLPHLIARFKRLYPELGSGVEAFEKVMTMTRELLKAAVKRKGMQA